ncbi:MAG: aldolase/citrate lyase family protein [Bacillota bacterium]
MSADFDATQPRWNEPEPVKGLRQRIKDGDVIFGPFMKLASPQVVEIAGYAGFDFVIFDTEHGPLTFETVENLTRAAERVGIAAIVRVYENSPPLVSRCLDVGAQGILVPHISSREEAATLSQAARFAPEGRRGVCCYVRAARFSHADKYRYFEEANENTLVVAMVEGREGVAHLDEILSVPGIDVIFVGPYDLSQSLGVPGQVDSPRVTREVERVVEEARSRGCAVGTFADDVSSARRWRDLGVQFISFSVDVGMIYTAMKNAVAALRA